MAKAGDQLVHPISGDRLRYLEVEGHTFRVEQVRMPGKFAIENHFHALQTESFEVIAGKARYTLNGQEGTLSAGEKVSFPPGTPHENPWNDGEGELHIIQSMCPALDFATLHEQMILAAGKGFVKPNGKVKLLPTCVYLRYTKSKTYSATLPLWLQKVLIAILGPIGRRLGY